MNSSIIFNDVELFNMAVNVLALDAIEYEVDADALTIYTNDAYALSITLESEGISHFDVDSDTGEGDERSYPGEDMDGDFDSAMASAGYGTSEDYGDFGGDE